MRIDWKDAAKIDASAILAYIAQNDLAAAYGVYHKIHQQTLMLAEFPQIGRKGRVKGTRELLVSQTPYIVAYRVGKNAVQILRILHSARNWPEQLE